MNWVNAKDRFPGVGSLPKSLQHASRRSQKPPRTTSTSLAVNDGVMNSAVYQKIPEENVRVLVCTLELKPSWVIHQDDDLNHTSTSEWLKKQKQSEVFGVM